MSRSAALRIRDVRAVDRVVNECLEHWHDADRWQTVLLDGARALVGLPTALVCELSTLDPGQEVQMRSAAELGWASTRVRDAFGAATREMGGRLFTTSPIDVAFRDRFHRRPAFTARQSDLINDRTWRSSRAYADAYRPADMREIIYSAVRLPQRDSVSLMVFGGPDRPAGHRTRGVLALLHHQVAASLGTRLATDREHGRHHLPRSQRSVFDLLMTGLDEKGIAARLFRSRSTINGHIAAIYRAFGVSSRAELMAQQIARRPMPILAASPSPRATRARRHRGIARDGR